MFWIGDESQNRFWGTAASVSFNSEPIDRWLDELFLGTGQTDVRIWGFFKCFRSRRWELGMCLAQVHERIQPPSCWNLFMTLALAQFGRLLAQTGMQQPSNNILNNPNSYPTCSLFQPCSTEPFPKKNAKKHRTNTPKTQNIEQTY